MLKQENLALYAFQTFGDNALRAAYCCTGSLAAAEQTAQAVFAALRREPPVLSDDAALKAWILRNVIVLCSRRSPAHPFAELPPHCAEIAYLYECEHYSASEIAELLGRPEHTVLT